MIRFHPYSFSALWILCLIGAVSGCRTLPESEKALHRAGLVEIKNVIPDIVLDIRYATPDNFTGQAVYPSARCFLTRDAVHALRAVQQDLRAEGYGLKIFDGYRPLSVQRRFWAIKPDPNFVADPAKGSRHNKGYAVDLSLVDLSGKEVAMPTPFDDFTERAHPDYDGPDLPPEARRHRALLRSVMEQHGFTVFPTEWWHYDFKGWEGRPNLDLPLPDEPEISAIMLKGLR